MLDNLDIDQGFPPAIGDHPEYLILGSMPGRKSLDISQYYGNPRNHFWWIMSEVFSVPLSLEYENRLKALVNKNVSLWDVAHRCQRPGSLDSDIVRESVEVNPILSLLNKYPSIRLVAFNGQMSFTLFKRYFGNELPVKHGILPSTSPANARFSKEQKLESWQRFFLG